MSGNLMETTWIFYISTPYPPHVLTAFAYCFLHFCILFFYFVNITWKRMDITWKCVDITWILRGNAWILRGYYVFEFFSVFVELK